MPRAARQELVYLGDTPVASACSMADGGIDIYPIYSWFNSGFRFREAVTFRYFDWGGRRDLLLTGLIIGGVAKLRHGRIGGARLDTTT